MDITIKNISRIIFLLFIISISVYFMFINNRFTESFVDSAFNEIPANIKLEQSVVGIDQDIVNIYNDILSRNPNENELKNYSSLLTGENSTFTIDKLKQLLLASNEYNRLEKTQSNLFNSDLMKGVSDRQLQFIITKIYNDITDNKYIDSDTMKFLKKQFINFNLNEDTFKTFLINFLNFNKSQNILQENILQENILQENNQNISQEEKKTPQENYDQIEMFTEQKLYLPQEATYIIQPKSNNQSIQEQIYTQPERTYISEDAKYIIQPKYITQEELNNSTYISQENLYTKPEKMYITQEEYNSTYISPSYTQPEKTYISQELIYIKPEVKYIQSETQQETQQKIKSEAQQEIQSETHQEIQSETQQEIQSKKQQENTQSEINKKKPKTQYIQQENLIQNISEIKKDIEEIKSEYAIIPKQNYLDSQNIIDFIKKQASEIFTKNIPGPKNKCYLTPNTTDDYYNKLNNNKNDMAELQNTRNEEELKNLCSRNKKFLTIDEDLLDKPVKNNQFLIPNRPIFAGEQNNYQPNIEQSALIGTLLKYSNDYIIGPENNPVADFTM